MATVRSHVIVAGRVQGVWFRESTRREAVAYGVSGWVRNLPTGEVEAVFEGPEPLVSAMVEWARTGPPNALVESLSETTEKPEGLTGFEIR